MRTCASQSFHRDSLRTDFDRVSWKPSHSFVNRFAGGIVYEPISIGLVGNVSAKTAEGPIAPPVYEPISIGLVGNSGTLLNCLGLFQTRLRTDFDRVSWKPFGDLWSSSPLWIPSLRTDFDRVSWKLNPCVFAVNGRGDNVYEPISIGLVGNVVTFLGRASTFGVFTNRFRSG